MADAYGNSEQIIRRDIAELAEDKRGDDLTIYTCPDCGGAMWQIDDGLSAQYACHVGHKYNPEYLFSQKTDELEGALWACVRLLTEKATLARQVANRSEGTGAEAIAERMHEQAEQDLANAKLIKNLLMSPQPVASQNS